jgi:hypothetical protein
MSTATKGTALVTGASAGIGAEYARQLAQRGYDVILLARNRQRLNALATRLANETRRSFEVVEADLATEAGIARAEAVLRSDASITLLINNAGAGSVATALEARAADMQGLIDVNVTALTRLTMAAVTAFAPRGVGTVVQISSVVALQPEWLNGVYSGTKAFVLAYSQALQRELSSKGIRIQVVLPGITRTEFWDLAGRPSASLPEQMTMSAQDLVTAALNGLEQGESVTIPSLPDVATWHSFDAARNALAPLLSSSQPASRYAAHAAPVS